MTEPPKIYAGPQPDDEVNLNADSQSEWNNMRAGTAPIFTETSTMPGRVLQLPVNTALRLKCVSDAIPTPKLIWFKVNNIAVHFELCTKPILNRNNSSE